MKDVPRKYKNYKINCIQQVENLVKKSLQHKMVKANQVSIITGTIPTTALKV